MLMDRLFGFVMVGIFHMFHFSSRQGTTYLDKEVNFVLLNIVEILFQLDTDLE